VLYTSTNAIRLLILIKVQIKHPMQVHTHVLEGAFGAVQKLRVYAAEPPSGADEADTVPCHILKYAAAPDGSVQGIRWNEHFEPLAISAAPTSRYVAVRSGYCTCISHQLACF
jgi:hypothetical protein